MSLVTAPVDLVQVSEHGGGILVGAGVSGHDSIPLSCRATRSARMP